MATARTEIAVDRVAAELLRALVDEVRTAPAHWQKLDEDQQGKLIDRLRETVKTETARAVQFIAQGAHDVARVKVESVTVKEGSKIVLKSLGDIHEVIDHVGKDAVLVMCDPAKYLDGLGEIKADKDQPDLPLEPSAGSPPGPVPLTADVKVGDRVRFLNAAPDGLVRDVRTVNRDVDPPLIEVTGMPDEFAIGLFELVTETDPIAEVEAEDRAETDRMAAESPGLTADVDEGDNGADDEDADEGLGDSLADEEAEALTADAADDEAERASAGKKRRRRS